MKVWSYVMKTYQEQKLLPFWKRLISGSTNRKILAAAITVGLGTLFVKLGTVAKELVIAWKFGTTDALDAFLIALVVPSFLITVVAGSFNAAFIPTYIKVREQQGLREAQRLFSGASAWSLGLLVVTTIIMLAIAPIYLPFMAAGFSAEKLDLAFKLLWAIAPLITISGIIVIWGAVLNAGERFALASLTPILAPSITIALLFGLNLGIFALVIGLIGGAILELSFLGFALRRQGMLLLPKLYRFDTHLLQVASQYVPAMTGSFLMCSTILVDQTMAAMFAPGSVSALNYGNKLIALPISLTTTALSTAVIPYFSKMVACQDWVGIRHTLQRYMWLIFIVTIPITIVFISFSETIVKIVFQRGSFTTNDTFIVAHIQSLYALQIPFYLAADFLVRLVSSMHLNQSLIYLSSCNLIINITLNYLFTSWIGIQGIALSTSCVYLFAWTYLFIFISKKIKNK